MKAYVITIENHDKSEAAAHRCIKSGLKNGIKIEKFYAVTPKDNHKQIFMDRGYPLEYFTEEFSKSENTTSTFLSHLFLWEKAVKLNEDVVIFEHDAVVFDKIPTDAIFKGCMTLVNHHMVIIKHLFILDLDLLHKNHILVERMVIL